MGFAVIVAMLIHSVSNDSYTISDEKKPQNAYTTKSSIFAYNCLSYISMLINLRGEENMTS